MTPDQRRTLIGEVEKLCEELTLSRRYADRLMAWSDSDIVTIDELTQIESEIQVHMAKADACRGIVRDLLLIASKTRG